MKDERLAEIEQHIADIPITIDAISVPVEELLQALKADRNRIAELKTECRLLSKMVTEQDVGLAELEAQIEKPDQPTHYWTEMMEYTSEDLHSVLDDEAADCGLEEGESCIVEVHLSRSLGIQNYKVTIKNGATTWEVSDE